MPEYVVTFVGHIDEHKRPDGLPLEVHDMVNVYAETVKELVDRVNEAALMYLRLQGMSVRRNAHGMEVAGSLEYDRMFVPMHMITHITSKISLVTPPPPPVSLLAEGAAKLPDGEGTVKQ